MGLLRYQVFLAYGVTFLSVWYYALQKQTAAEWNTTLPSWMVTLAPLWAIVAVGLVLLTRLILGVLAYQDCPEAAKEIEQQIKEAKAEMKKRNIIKD